MLAQFLTLFFSRLLNFFNSVVVVKALGPEKIGYSAILQSVTHQFGVLNELGLSELAAREKNSPDFAQLCTDIIFFRFTCFVVAALLGLCILAFFPALSLPPLIIAILGFAIFKNAIDPMFYFRATGQMRIYYLVGMVAPVCVTVFYLLFLETFLFRGIDFIAIHLSVGVVNLLLFAIMMRSIGVQRPNLRRSIDHVIKNWKLANCSIVAMTIAACQIFVAALVLDLSEMGLVRAAVILLVPAEILFTVVQNYFFPRVMDWARDGTVRKQCGHWLKTFAAPVGLVFCFLAFFPWEVIDVVLGKDFEFSAVYLAIVLVGKIVLIYTIPCQVVLWTDKTNNAITMATLAILIVFICLGIPIIAIGGKIGLALSSVSIDVVFAAYALYFTFFRRGTSRD